MILLMGFGAFEGVPRNPSERLVGDLDGRRILGHTIVGRAMPVSYERCIGLTCGLAEILCPEVVIGIGVATQRDRPEFELQAVNDVAQDRMDVDGKIPSVLEASGPRVRSASFPVDAASRGLAGGISRDAGTYVCNGWLYRVTGRLTDSRVGFLHLPPEGVSVSRALRTILLGLGEVV